MKIKIINEIFLPKSNLIPLSHLFQHWVNNFYTIPSIIPMTDTVWVPDSFRL